MGAFTSSIPPPNHVMSCRLRVWTALIRSPPLKPSSPGFVHDPLPHPQVRPRCRLMPDGDHQCAREDKRIHRTYTVYVLAFLDRACRYARGSDIDAYPRDSCELLPTREISIAHNMQDRLLLWTSCSADNRSVSGMSNHEGMLCKIVSLVRRHAEKEVAET